MYRSLGQYLVTTLSKDTKFIKWISDNGGSFDDETNPKATFTMPQGDTILTAVIEIEYELALFSGFIVSVNGEPAPPLTSEGWYPQNTEIEIESIEIASDALFIGWDDLWTNPDTMMLENLGLSTIVAEHEPKTSLIIPGRNVRLMANIILAPVEPPIRHRLDIIINYDGDIHTQWLYAGWRTALRPDLEHWDTFIKWEPDTYITIPERPLWPGHATLTMPDYDITVTAIIERDLDTPPPPQGVTFRPSYQGIAIRWMHWPDATFTIAGVQPTVHAIGWMGRISLATYDDFVRIRPPSTHHGGHFLRLMQPVPPGRFSLVWPDLMLQGPAMVDGKLLFSSMDMVQRPEGHWELEVTPIGPPGVEMRVNNVNSWPVSNIEQNSLGFMDTDNNLWLRMEYIPSSGWRGSDWNIVAQNVASAHLYNGALYYNTFAGNLYIFGAFRRYTFREIHEVLNLSTGEITVSTDQTFDPIAYDIPGLPTNYGRDHSDRQWVTGGWYRHISGQTRRRRFDMGTFSINTPMLINSNCVIFRVSMLGILIDTFWP